VKPTHRETLPLLPEGGAEEEPDIRGTFAALDFETANSFPPSPCSLGIAIVREGRILREYRRLITPPGPFRWFDAFNVRVHGIRPRDVEGAPEFPQVWEEAEALVRDLPLVAHNGRFDFEVLDLTLFHYGLRPVRNRLFCSLILAQRVWPDLPSKGLKAVSDHLGFRFRHHDALEDARACAFVAARALGCLGAADLPEAEDRLDLDFGAIFPRPEEEGRAAAYRKILDKAREQRRRRLFSDRDFWAPGAQGIHESPQARKRLGAALRAETEPLALNREHGTARFSGSGGQVYRTSLRGCDCLDYVTRRLPCKHMYRLALALRAFPLEATAETQGDRAKPQAALSASTPDRDGPRAGGTGGGDPPTPAASNPAPLQLGAKPVA